MNDKCNEHFRGCHRQPPGRNIKMTFKRAEIIYDVENCSYVEADLMEDSHNRHLVFDIAQDGNVNRVTRVLNMAVSECIEMLYPYTKEMIPEEPDEIDNILTAPDEYEISLKLPVSFSQTTVDLLKQLIHEYLVYRILVDWFSITKPESMATWELKMADVKGRIKTTMSIRRGKTRRQLSPF